MSAMKFTLTPLPAFRDNYIWFLTDTDGNAVAVDPGDASPVERALNARNFKLRAVLVTHHHADHMGGAAELAHRHGCPVFGPALEAQDAVTVALRQDMEIGITGMETRFRVLDIPGHTAGHIAFAGPGVVFCGDTLFSAGCGRLFEGTPAEMWASLQKLAALPDDTRVCCGHEYTLANLRFASAVEPENAAVREYTAVCATRRARGEPTLPSTLATERRVNPFLRCNEVTVRDAASRRAGRELTDAVEVFAVVRKWKDGF